MSIWFQLPSEWRAVSSIRYRVICVLIFHLCTVLVTLFYSCYWWLFTIIPSQYQPGLALALPVIREIFGHFLSKLGQKCATTSVPSVELNIANIVALFHALFLASCVGSIATSISAYILLGIDFAINLLFTFQIYYYHRKGNIEKCAEAMMTVVLNEFLEMFVPLTFLLCFLVSFYGGNSNLIGEFQHQFMLIIFLLQETLAVITSTSWQLHPIISLHLSTIFSFSLALTCFLLYSPLSSSSLLLTLIFSKYARSIRIYTFNYFSSDCRSIVSNNASLAWFLQDRILTFSTISSVSLLSDVQLTFLSSSPGFLMASSKMMLIRAIQLTSILLSSSKTVFNSVCSLKRCLAHIIMLGP